MMPAGCWLGLANTQAGSRDRDPVHDTHVWTLSVSSLLNNGNPDNSCHSKCDSTLISVFRSERGSVLTWSSVKLVLEINRKYYTHISQYMFTPDHLICYFYVCAGGAGWQGGQFGAAAAGGG